MDFERGSLLLRNTMLQLVSTFCNIRLNLLESQHVGPPANIIRKTGILLVLE